MGGYCADRYGRKTMMVIGSIGQGISFLIFALANSPWLDAPWLSFMCYALAGVFGSFYWPASQAMVADVVDEKDRNHVFAIFYTMINIAVVVGPLLGAIFYTYYRFELLLVAGVICIVLGFVLIKYIRETVPVSNIHVKDHNEKWYAFLQNQIKEYGIIAKDKTFLMFIIAGVIGAQTFMQLDMLFPVYIKDE
jgi:MFS family permease